MGTLSATAVRLYPREFMIYHFLRERAEGDKVWFFKGQLARSLDVSAGNLHQSLKALIEKGLLAYEPSGEDEMPGVFTITEAEVTTL